MSSAPDSSSGPFAAITDRLPRRRIIIAVVALAIVVRLYFQLAAPSDHVGRWARYEFPEGSPIPGATGIVLSIPEIDEDSHDGGLWWRMQVDSADGKMFAIDLRAASLDFLYPGSPVVGIHRYLIEPAGGQVIEYVDDATGTALLPALHFFQHLLPHAATPTDPAMPFFKSGTWLGKPIRRSKTGGGADAPALDNAKLLRLDGDVLIGTSRSFRDDRSGRLYEAIADYEREGPEYEYVPLDGLAYSEMMEAGFNIFRVPQDHLDFVIDQPVWVVSRQAFDTRPDLLFRSNFYGAVMYMDEPAFRSMAFDHMFASFADPGKPATVVRELTAGRYAGSGSYGRGYLQHLLEEAGWDLGEIDFPQWDYPVWEAAPSACWYEMEAGVSGWLMEGRIQPAWFSALVHDRLGVNFPEDAESNLRFQHAFFTGAARHFDARWGTSIYGMMAPEAAELVFPLAYDQGATYFWLWTSGQAHHVPFDEQLEYARILRQHMKQNPRPSRRHGLEAARVAIALPWGYLFDKYQLHTYPHMVEGFDKPAMWWSERMELDDDNGDGATYGQVLAAAAGQAAELLRAGRSFDFIFLHPGQAAPAGYDEVRRVLTDASVR